MATYFQSRDRVAALKEQYLEAKKEFEELVDAMHELNAEFHTLEYKIQRAGKDSKMKPQAQLDDEARMRQRMEEISKRLAELTGDCI